MNITWEIIEEKVPNGPVALLKKNDGPIILYVHEGTNHHFSSPCGQFYFLNSRNIPYPIENRELIAKHKNDKTSFTPEQVKRMQLEIGCEILAADVEGQFSRIAALIS